MSLEQDNVDVDVNAILKPYFSEISSLNQSLKQHENMVDYYTLKTKMINDEIDNQLKQLNQEEIELSQKFITCVENEEFYIHPTEENVDLINNAKQYKDIYNKKKEQYITQMKQIENKEKALNDKLSQLDSEKQELYKNICDLILNNGKNLQSDNKKEEELINNNQGIIKVIKAKCSQIKNKNNTKETKRTRSFSNSNNNNNNNKQRKGSSVNKNKNNKKRHYNISSSPNKTYNNASNYSISSSQIALNTKHKNNLHNNTSSNNHNGSNSKNKMNGNRKRFNSSLTTTKPKKNNSYSNIPIHLTNQSNVHNNNNNVSSIVIKNNACDNIKNTNKSFFLLKNARLEKSLQHSSNIMSQEDLGGEYCCYKLLRNYKNDLKNVEDLSDDSHYLNKSSSNQYSKPRSVSRYKNNCNRSFTNEDKSLRRERLEYKLSNTPKLCVRGKYVNQNLIGQATDTENGIL